MDYGVFARNLKQGGKRIHSPAGQATTRPTPHPKVISLIDGKLKDVGRSMTRGQLVDGRERYLKKKEV